MAYVEESGESQVRDTVDIPFAKLRKLSVSLYMRVGGLISSNYTEICSPSLCSESQLLVLCDGREVSHAALFALGTPSLLPAASLSMC